VRATWKYLCRCRSKRSTTYKRAILDSDGANSLTHWGPDIGGRLGELLGDQTRPACNQLITSKRSTQQSKPVSVDYRQPQTRNHPSMEITFEGSKEGHTRLLRISWIHSVGLHELSLVTIDRILTLRTLRQKVLRVRWTMHQTLFYASRAVFCAFPNHRIPAWARQRGQLVVMRR
jgi:hypothetical protein